jgi:formylglycine-generating enzyme required for sulfatase activity
MLVTKRFEPIFLIFVAVTCAAGAVRSQPTTPSWAKVSKEQLAEAKKLGVPVAFEDAIGIKFVLVPAGEFMMGSADDEEGRYEVEGPQHKVTIKKPFYISIHQITQGQWESVTGTRPWEGENKHNTKSGRSHAANYINWEDATDFCASISKRDGRTYRLPTEAEWEYACRAGGTTRYCYGDDVERLHEYSWYIEVTWPKPEERHPHAVGTRKANAWGIYDMHGNVWEACLDTQHTNYEGAPADGSAWIKDGETTNIDGREVMRHPLRGGGLRSTDRRVRTASRYSYPQTLSSYYTGFRVVAELKH